MVDFHGAPHEFIQDHEFIQVTSTSDNNDFVVHVAGAETGKTKKITKRLLTNGK